MSDEAYFKTLPKVSLHDHLDGGLRPQTMLEIAAEIGHELPARTAEELADWFFAAASSGSLTRYLSTFEHTIACLQRPEDLERVAREWVLDQAADGVIAAEARWAPEQHLGAGLTLDAAVEAVARGLRAGVAEVSATGRSFIARQLVTAMRHADRGLEIAELALRHRDENLVSGFDLAGGESGNPPAKHLAAFRRLRAENFYYTIHAGEEGPLESLHEAVQVCGALRLGHGVNVIKDISRDETGEYHLGGLASFIRNQRIPLEVCPSSNLQTGVVSEMTGHPFGTLLELGFVVTLNPDNRLMGRTTLSREYALVAEAFEISLGQLRPVAIAAADAMFLDHPERIELVGLIDRAWSAAVAGQG